MDTKLQHFMNWNGGITEKRLNYGSTKLWQDHVKDSQHTPDKLLQGGLIIYVGKTSTLRLNPPS